jgi:hypothetical protein
VLAQQHGQIRTLKSVQQVSKERDTLLQRFRQIGVTVGRFHHQAAATIQSHHVPQVESIDEDVPQQPPCVV